MNVKSLAYKLQNALCMRGEPVKINQVQYYNEKNKKMGTKFVVIKTEKIAGRNKNTKILETYSIADVAKCLAELYGGDSE